MVPSTLPDQLTCSQAVRQRCAELWGTYKVMAQVMWKTWAGQRAADLTPQLVVRAPSGSPYFALYFVGAASLRLPSQCLASSVNPLSHWRPASRLALAALPSSSLTITQDQDSIYQISGSH